MQKEEKRNLPAEKIQDDLNMGFRISLFKVLLTLFIMVFSIFVLAESVPEMKFVQNTIERLEDSEKTIMKFSGTTIGVSLAITALPDDFATPLADTLADMNTYFVFMFAILFVEKLIVVEGIGIVFTYFIPCACILYILSLIAKKEVFMKFAVKVFVLGLAVLVVIPFSLFFAENIGEDYLSYVDETIDEADDGAEKITDIMNSQDGNETMFEKLSAAFKTAIEGVEDLMLYFKNVVKKFVNAIAILLVTTFVIPLLILFFFKWLMKELFSLNLTIVIPKLQFPHKQKTVDKLDVQPGESTEIMECLESTEILESVEDAETEQSVELEEE